MTILNLIVRPDVVHIATDTSVSVRNVVDPDRGLVPGVSKVFMLPHLPAVVTGRGQVEFIFNVWLRVAACWGARFDELIEAMPHLFWDTHVATAAAWAERGLPVPADFGMVYLAGYNRLRGRMQAQVYFHDGKPGRAVEAYECAEFVAAPSCDGFNDVPDDDSKASMADLMRRQVLRFKSEQQPCLGGNMVWTTLTRTGVSSELVSLSEGG